MTDVQDTTNSDDTTVAIPDPAASPSPPQEPPKEPQANPWLKRLGEQSAKIREAEERLAMAERRAQEAEALAQRLQSVQPPQAAQQPPQGQQTPDPRTLAPQVSEEQRRAEIQREAQRQRFAEDTIEIRNKGYAQYGFAWNDTLSILNSMVSRNQLDEFVADIMAVDKVNAHEMISALSKDPDKLTALGEMNSRQRIAELTRMTMTPKSSQAAPNAPAPAPKTTSKAPPPAPPIVPSASKAKDRDYWRTDAASDEEFHRGFDEMAVARSRRR